MACLQRNLVFPDRQDPAWLAFRRWRSPAPQQLEEELSRANSDCERARESHILSTSEFNQVQRVFFNQQQQGILQVRPTCPPKAPLPCALPDT